MTSQPVSSGLLKRHTVNPRISSFVQKLEEDQEAEVHFHSHTALQVIFTATMHYKSLIKTKKALPVTAVAAVRPSTTITLNAHLTDNNQLESESTAGRNTECAYRVDQRKDLVRKVETKAETKRRILMFFSCLQWIGVSQF